MVARIQNSLPRRGNRKLEVARDKGKPLKSLNVVACVLNGVAHRFGENRLSRVRFGWFGAGLSKQVPAENRANTGVLRDVMSLQRIVEK
jgi:hypothetical protein